MVSTCSATARAQLRAHPSWRSVIAAFYNDGGLEVVSHVADFKTVLDAVCRFVGDGFGPGDASDDGSSSSRRREKPRLCDAVMIGKGVPPDLSNESLKHQTFANLERLNSEQLR